MFTRNAHTPKCTLSLKLILYQCNSYFYLVLFVRMIPGCFSCSELVAQLHRYCKSSVQSEASYTFAHESVLLKCSNQQQKMTRECIQKIGGKHTCYGVLITELKDLQYMNHKKERCIPYKQRSACSTSALDPMVQLSFGLAKCFSCMFFVLL